MKRYTVEELESIKEMLEAGKSRAEIAAIMGRTEEGIRVAAIRHNLTRRKHVAVTIKTVRAISELRKAGCTYNEITRKTGISSRRIAYIIHSYVIGGQYD